MRALVIAWTLVLAGSAGTLRAATLRPETVSAWNRYVRLVEARIERELADGDRFLTSDFLPRAEAAEIERRLRVGEIVTQKLETLFDVPGGMIHHWVGSVFVPAVEVDALVRWLQSYDDHHRYFDEVERSRLLWRDGDDYGVFLRLRRRKIVTVHYDTEHRVRYRRHRDGRVSSASTATRIAELEDAGAGSERERPIGDDRGFLWRLSSYWRFQQTRGGVVVECESVSLSRSVPAPLRYLVGGFLDSVPRESLEATLGPIRSRSPAALRSDDEQP